MYQQHEYTYMTVIFDLWASPLHDAKDSGFMAMSLQYHEYVRDTGFTAFGGREKRDTTRDGRHA